MLLDTPALQQGLTVLKDATPDIHTIREAYVALMQEDYKAAREHLINLFAKYTKQAAMEKISTAELEEIYLKLIRDIPAYFELLETVQLRMPMTYYE
jgi:hypothetical protein